MDTTKEQTRKDICIDCRTVLHPDEACDGGARHRTASLGDPEGREALLRDVWGPPGLRRRAKQIAAAGGGGAVVGSALEGGCNVGCGVLDCASGLADFPAALVVIALAAVGIGVYLLVSWILRRVRERRHGLKPNGALLRPLLPRGQTHHGVVGEGASTTQSLSGEVCVAHGLSLRCKRFLRSDLMLYDGRSAGFTLRLADGREVRVPAGRVRLLGPRRQERDVAPARVRLELNRLDPLRARPENAEELDPLPFDRAGELVLRPGDAVELIGAFEPVIDRAAQTEAGYRASAASVLKPSGPFHLRLVPPRAG